MRQWMVNPKILCTKHLLGEHVEHHMFVGTINKGLSVEGYIKNNLLEPLKLHERHLELVKEMKSRNMKHNSELVDIDLSKLRKYQKNYIIDKESSLKDLINRCPECKKRYEELDENIKHS